MYSDVAPDDPGRSLERCSDLHLQQCDAEVSGYEAIWLVGILRVGSPNPTLLPHPAATRVARPVPQMMKQWDE